MGIQFVVSRLPALGPALVRPGRWLAALALVGALILGGFAPATISTASGHSYEVWVIDQADADKGGAKLYIYVGEQLEGGQVAGAADVIDLAAAARGVGDGAGVRPHLLTFNANHSHALIANVASGHVYVMRAADRRIVASIDVGQQAHGAVASPDGRLILAANQNGKKLARIASDFVRESFTYDPADDLDLGAIEDADHPDNAPICPLLFTADGSRAYVTVRGGGLYIVDVRSTPMRILASYGKDEIAPAGCGGLAVGSKIYINSGLATSSDLYVFDGRTDQLIQHLPMTDLGLDGHGMVQAGRYLWMNNRASSNIVIVDSASDRVTGMIDGFGKAPDLMDISPDGNWVYLALRGPNNLTGGPPAKGETPGFAILRVAGGGAAGSFSHFVPIGDQGPDSPVDPHALAVRRLPAAPKGKGGASPAQAPRSIAAPVDAAIEDFEEFE